MAQLEKYPGGVEPGRFETEKERLQTLLKQNHMILFKTGLVQKMMEVQQRLFDEGKSAWSPGELGDSKFWLTTAGWGSYPVSRRGEGDFIQRTRYFEIAKADGEGLKNQVECRVFAVSEDGTTRVQTLKIEDGFDMRDAVIVYVLTQRLIEAKQTGEITHLNPNLHSLSSKPTDFDIGAQRDIEFFPVDELLLDLDLFSEGFF